jgi:hypothetical protein
MHVSGQAANYKITRRLQQVKFWIVLSWQLKRHQWRLDRFPWSEYRVAVWSDLESTRVNYAGIMPPCL